MKKIRILLVAHFGIDIAQLIGSRRHGSSGEKNINKLLRSMKMKFIRSLIAATVLVTSASQAVAAYTTEFEPNNTFGSAQSIDAFFTLDSDPLITNSTTWAHASAQGNGTADAGVFRDFFRFTAYGGNVLFDIDFGMSDLDSWLNLYNSAGTIIGFHDDGGVLDPGTSHGFDSYWMTLLSPGQYVVEVARYFNSPLSPGQDYTLHVSLERHNVPEPSSLALASIGLLGAGATMWRRKARKSTSDEHTLIA